MAMAMKAQPHSRTTAEGSNIQSSAMPSQKAMPITARSVVMPSTHTYVRVRRRTSARALRTAGVRPGFVVGSGITVVLRALCEAIHAANDPFSEQRTGDQQ